MQRSEVTEAVGVEPDTVCNVARDRWICWAPVKPVSLVISKAPLRKWAEHANRRASARPVPQTEKENLSCGDRHSPERTLTGQRAGQREAELRSVRPQRSMVK